MEKLKNTESSVHHVGQIQVKFGQIWDKVHNPVMGELNKDKESKFIFEIYSASWVKERGQLLSLVQIGNSINICVEKKIKSNINIFN